METGWNENRVELRGTVCGEPGFSHESHGERFYCFPLEVKRLSGLSDILNIILSERLLQAEEAAPGVMLEVEGELRSYNNKSGVGNRLVITVFARRAGKTEGEARNYILLAGALCKPPILRRTPLGRDICDLMLAVNRRYGRADYLPCIAWGQVAAEAGKIPVGGKLRIEGRVQSRTYIKMENGENRERVAYEVSVMKLLGDSEESI